MPIYEFKCRDCEKEFQSLVFRSSEIVKCKGCGSENVSKLMSSFSSKISGGHESSGPSSSGGCSSCSTHNCSTCR